jgi:predicted enzyme related to lactoylglutathione lyase
MINAVHALVYAKDAEKARAFFKDVLGWPSVDAGRGWLIFGLPPAEIAAHPAENAADNGKCELYLMCDDVQKTVAELKAKGVKITTPIADHGYGLVTAIQIPGAGTMGLYQPKHPVAYNKKRAAPKKARPRPGKGRVSRR